MTAVSYPPVAKGSAPPRRCSGQGARSSSPTTLRRCARPAPPTGACRLWSGRAGARRRRAGAGGIRGVTQVVRPLEAVERRLVGLDRRLVLAVVLVELGQLELQMRLRDLAARRSALRTRALRPAVGGRCRASLGPMAARETEKDVGGQGVPLKAPGALESGVVVLDRLVDVVIGEYASPRSSRSSATATSSSRRRQMSSASSKRSIALVVSCRARFAVPRPRSTRPALGRGRGSRRRAGLPATSRTPPLDRSRSTSTDARQTVTAIVSGLSSPPCSCKRWRARLRRSIAPPRSPRQ